MEEELKFIPPEEKFRQQIQERAAAWLDMIETYCEDENIKTKMKKIIEDFRDKKEGRGLDDGFYFTISQLENVTFAKSEQIRDLYYIIRDDIWKFFREIKS